MGSDRGVQEIKCDSGRCASGLSCFVLRSHIRLGVSGREKKKIKNDDCRAAGRINPVRAVWLDFTSLIQCMWYSIQKKGRNPPLPFTKTKKNKKKTAFGASAVPPWIINEGLKIDVRMCNIDGAWWEWTAAAKKKKQPARIYSTYIFIWADSDWKCDVKTSRKDKMTKWTWIQDELQYFVGGSLILRRAAFMKGI